MRILQTIRNASLQFSRSIHIHKDVISGQNGQIIIAHGMLGSSGNWSSLSRRIAQETGKSVVTFDARNHGMSEHTETMSYPEMAEDMKSLITESKATLIGHSMGGRTAMYFALKYPDLVDKLAIVDVSPVNIDSLTTAEPERIRRSHGTFCFFLFLSFSLSLSINTTSPGNISSLIIYVHLPHR